MQVFKTPIQQRDRSLNTIRDLFSIWPLLFSPLFLFGFTGWALKMPSFTILKLQVHFHSSGKYQCLSTF